MNITETENFILKVAEKPHIDRKDGGHLVILPKRAVKERQDLTEKEAIELMFLTIVAGSVLKNTLAESGIKIGRINYQDNGNWSVFKPSGPSLHIHIYGRATGAKIQKYGQALHFPHPNEEPEFYAKLEPIKQNETENMQELAKEMWTKYQKILDKIANLA